MKALLERDERPALHKYEDAWKEEERRDDENLPRIACVACVDSLIGTGTDRGVRLCQNKSIAPVDGVEWKYWRMEYWSVVPVNSSLRYPITPCHFSFGSSRIGALD